MKLNVRIDLNLKIPEATEKVAKAAREAMKDTVVDVTADAVKGSPVLTGNNRRSLVGETDNRKVEGKVFSSSGYGGFLETGTSKRAATPYIKPAADKHVPNFPKRMEAHLGRF